MRLRAWWLCLLVWMLPAFALAQTPGQPVKASLATMAPGDQFWSVFGHNALILEFADRPAQSYNFGYFDFNEPGFLRNFVFGEMAYLAVRLPADRDLGNYLSDGRAVWMQELALDPAQLSALFALLETHVRPENARYRYDYFRNNCSTKLRDALDTVTGGAVRAALVRRSHGYNFRGLALAQSGGVPWMYAGMHAGLGRGADRPLSLWDESYIPALLLEALREVRLPAADGSTRALVAAERALDPELSMPPARTSLPLSWPWFLLAGVVWGLLLWRAPLGLASAGGAFSSLVLGLAGVLLLFFWLASAHWAAAWNQNLVLFNPLYLGLLLLWWPVRTRRWLQQQSLWLFVLGALGSFCKVLPAFDQQNIEWVLLLLPVQFGLWQLARRRNPETIAS